MVKEEKTTLISKCEQDTNKYEDNSARNYKTLESPIVTEQNRAEEEKSFIRKHFIHVILWFSMFNIGWVNSLLGPAFPDIMKITGVSSGAASVFVAANHAGMFFGSSVCGLIIDRYNQYIVMMFASFCFGSATFAYPMCSIYWTMILVNLVQGFGCGMLLTGGFTNSGQLHPTGASARSFIQSLQVFIAVGSILAPLAVSPFLSSDPSEQMASINVSSTVYPAFNGGSTEYPAFNGSSFREPVLYDEVYKMNTLYIGSSHTARTTEPTDGDAVSDQRLIIPFSFSAALLLLLLLMLLLKFMEHPGLKASDKKSGEIQSKIPEREPPLSQIVRIVKLYLIGQLGFLHSGAENSYIQFLPAFLHRELGWTKVLSSQIMLVFWAVNTFGRIMGIAVSYYMKSATYLLLDILFFIVSMAVLLVGTYFKLNSLMWVSTASIGLALATFSPCLVSWSHSELLSNSGKANSFLMLTNCFGSVVLPLVFGNLMDIDYVWFVYILLASSFILLVNLACLFVFVRMKLRNNKDAPTLIFVNKKGKCGKMKE